MRFTTILAMQLSAAAAFLAARQLMSSDAAAQIQRLPEGARAPLLAARRALERSRERVAVAWGEARAERDEAERELREDYRRRTAFPPPNAR